jgi:hypothetical protein
MYPTLQNHLMFIFLNGWFCDTVAPLVCSMAKNQTQDLGMKWVWHLLHAVVSCTFTGICCHAKKTWIISITTVTIPHLSHILLFLTSIHLKFVIICKAHVFKQLLNVPENLSCVPQKLRVFFIAYQLVRKYSFSLILLINATLKAHR